MMSTIEVIANILAPIVVGFLIGRHFYLKYGRPVDSDCKCGLGNGHTCDCNKEE